MTWLYDPDNRELVARRLWELLPTFYRVQDQPPRGEYELRQFLRILSAPLALIRQNIEELHADLFIDTCGEQAIALLGDLVATKLLFPNADANRRDVRGTIAWRRRKGTPVMLEEMARELSDELVVLHEGWQHVQLAQDLDLLRLERQAPDLRPAVVAETSHGPLDRMHHAVDIRSISATTGKYHPRHIVHWRHPTKTWPVSEGTAAAHASDIAGRYTVHPLGGRTQLLARSEGVDDQLDSDRIPPMHFAMCPGDWFDRTGRFTIRVASLPAAIAEPEIEERQASEVLADLELAEGDVTLTVLDRQRDCWTQPVEVSLCVLALAVDTPDTLGTIDARAIISFDNGGDPVDEGGNAGTIVIGNPVVMLRLSPSAGMGCFFPGATVAITGGRAAARLAHPDSALSLRGYLRGALVVEIPPTWVFENRWFYVAADGSLISAQQTGAGEADVALIDDGGELHLDLEHLASLGPAAAWPPRRPTTSLDRISRLPPTPGRGPAVLHGGVVVDASSSNEIGAVPCALEFAAATLDAGVFSYAPMVRLSWTGSDPSAAIWEVLDEAGDPVAELDIDARFEAIAQLREDGASGLRLVVRFVCDEPGARMAPAEVAWSAHDGRTYLLYLPQLDADAAPTDWLATDHAYASVIVEPGEDGSTWFHGGGLARMAEGELAPLREYVGHRRRRLRWRKLCPWDNEAPEDIPPKVLPSPDPGYLDVDVEHGYFAFAESELPQSWPAGPTPESDPPPPSVTVDYEDGYSDHVGARPASRELELDARLPAPTRIVSRSGALSQANDISLNQVPRYTSLRDALMAIDGSNATEVVQFEDSATYPSEIIAWPSGLAHLVIQAAEGQRPVIEVVNVDTIPLPDPPPPPSFESLSLRGLAWYGGFIPIPHSDVLRLEWCSMLESNDSLVLDVSDAADVRIDHCVLARVQVNGNGTLVVRDSIVDVGKGSTSTALELLDAELDIERSTVIGEVEAFALEASEVLFNDLVTVTDRFRGCIRYSSIPDNCVLPRHHRCVFGLAPRFVSFDRLHRAHLRLATEAPVEIRFGAEDGGEIGVFHELHSGKRREALIRRLDEYTPVGLVSGLVRID